MVMSYSLYYLCSSQDVFEVYNLLEFPEPVKVDYVIPLSQGYGLCCLFLDHLRILSDHNFFTRYLLL